MPFDVLVTDAASLLTGTPNSRLLQALHDLISRHSIKRLGVPLRQNCDTLCLSALEFVSEGEHEGRSYSRFSVQAQAATKREEDVIAYLTLVVDKVSYADR